MITNNSLSFWQIIESVEDIITEQERGLFNNYVSIVREKTSSLEEYSEANMHIIRLQRRLERRHLDRIKKGMLLQYIGDDDIKLLNQKPIQKNAILIIQDITPDTMVVFTAGKLINLDRHRHIWKLKVLK